jgi:hypothetical protein
MTEKVREQLHRIVDLFQSENIPKAIKEVTFPPYVVPSNKWSLSNRIIMFFSGTSDARGFNQWKQADRKVRKGSKAVFILAPSMARKVRCESCQYDLKAQEKDRRSCPSCHAPLTEKSVKTVLTGFRGVPVFRMEDTEGEPLDYERIELPDLPLLDVAQHWGLKVRSMAFQGRFMGFYRPGDKSIGLASPEEKTFFHELAHASQDRLGLLRKEKSNAFNEVTAELSALVLAELVGRESANPGATYRYITHHLKTDDKAEIGKYLLKVLSSTEKIVNTIITASLTLPLQEQMSAEAALAGQDA